MVGRAAAPNHGGKMIPADLKTVALGPPAVGTLQLAVFCSGDTNSRNTPDDDRGKMPPATDWSETLQPRVPPPNRQVNREIWDESFWLLRRLPEANVYLGAFLDGAGGVHELLEIWVQRVAGYAANHPEAAMAWTNPAVDRCFSMVREEMAVADGAASLRLEIGAFPGTWEVCQDDALLLAAGLPAYTASLHRYLYNAETKGWVALSGAPLLGEARDFATSFPGVVCFNPEGGALFARRAGIMGWRDYAGCLRGGAWKADVPLEWLATLPPVYGALASNSPEESHWKHFLMPRLGEQAGLNETLYLKLALLHGAVEAIAAGTALRGRAYLNLSDAHFGIRLSDGGAALPALWTARVVLARSGGDAPEGPYRIPGPTRTRRVTGSLRIRKVGEVVDGTAVVEATLQSDEDLGGHAGFRLEIRFETPAGALVIPGEMSEGVSARDWLFAGKISGGMRAGLVEGGSYAKVELLLHPKLGSACDLYALGILGLQVLFETPERSLAVVVDDALREPGSLLGGGEDLLWGEALALVMRMLGGDGGYFRSAADGLEGLPEGIYREVLGDLAGLVVRARSLVLGESSRNREIRDLIEEERRKT